MTHSPRKTPLYARERERENPALALDFLFKKVVTPLYQTYVDIMRRCAVMDANVRSAEPVYENTLRNLKKLSTPHYSRAYETAEDVLFSPTRDTFSFERARVCALRGFGEQVSCFSNALCVFSRAARLEYVRDSLFHLPLSPSLSLSIAPFVKKQKRTGRKRGVHLRRYENVCCLSPPSGVGAFRRAFWKYVWLQQIRSRVEPWRSASSFCRRTASATSWRQR